MRRSTTPMSTGLDAAGGAGAGTGTRFVVVTHHPLTMARMDRLYGVTMAERGISQLVSVDLRTARGAARDRLTHRPTPGRLTPFLAPTNSGRRFGAGGVLAPSQW